MIERRNVARREVLLGLAEELAEDGALDLDLDSAARALDMAARDGALARAGQIYSLA